MRDVGRDVDEVSGAGFIDKLQMISPAKAGAAAYDVNDGFEFPVMMGAGLGVGMDDDGSCPQLLRTDSGTRDGFGGSYLGSAEYCCRVRRCE
ncbi:MAG: hypothetical protein WAM13_15300 [Candidatus Sulfotelmatobacter sp.]